MKEDIARQFALAIAKTNGHPNPEQWADTVSAHYTGKEPPLQEEPPAEPPEADAPAADGEQAAAPQA